MADVKTTLVLPGKRFSVSKLIKRLVQAACGAAVSAGVDYRNRGWQCRSCPFAEPCRP